MNFTYLYLAIGLYVVSFIPVIVTMRTKSKNVKALAFVIDGLLTFAGYTLAWFAIGDTMQAIIWLGSFMIVEMAIAHEAFEVLGYDPYGIKAHNKRKKKGLPTNDEYLRGYEDGKADAA